MSSDSNWRWDVINARVRDVSLTQQALHSFDDLIIRKVPAIVADHNKIDVTSQLVSNGPSRRVTFSNPTFKQPSVVEKNQDVRPLTAQISRIRDLTFSAPFYVDITYQPDKNTTRQISSQDIKDTQDTAKGAVTGFIGNTQNSYLPTISSSQKLTNAIYQGVVKGSSHLIPYIDKSVIEKVLIHYNISEKSDIDRNSIQKLMGVLQNIADRLKQKSLESVPQNT